MKYIILQKLFLSVMLVVFCSGIILAQNPIVRIQEGPVGTFTVNLEFTADPLNTDVSLQQTTINIYTAEQPTYTNITGSWAENFFADAAAISGFCSNAPSQRGVSQMNAADVIDLDDLRTGGTVSLFSFTSPRDNFPQVIMQSTSCEVIGPSGTTFDPDGTAGPTDAEPRELEGAQTLLPVELTRFTASKFEEKNSILKWETASEINNDYFNIERSADGKSYTTIGKVLGNGTTTETQNYEFIDREPIAGLNYYRLKQVDFNGEYEYSKVETVDFRTGTEGDIKIFPNPAVDYVNIQLDRTYEGVKITNQLGQLVENIPASTFEKNYIKLNIAGYTPGVYYIEARLDHEIVNKQFVKLK